MDFEGGIRQEALAYLMAQRESTAPFDVVFAGETSADCEQGAKTVHPYREARVTWWLEVIWTERGASSKGRHRLKGSFPEVKRLSEGGEADQKGDEGEGLERIKDAQKGALKRDAGRGG